MSKESPDQLYTISSDPTAKKPLLDGWTFAVFVVAIAMSLYQFILHRYMTLSDLAFKDIHYGFILTLVFLTAMRKFRKQRWLWGSMIILSLISTAYIYINEEDLILRAGSPIGLDLPIGTCLVVLALLATWRCWGLAIPLISLSFIALAFVIRYLPPPLYGPSPTFSRLITMLSIGLTGMWGTMLSTSSSVIFYFMVFGALFEVTGCTLWFDEVGKLVGRASKAGPAQTCIVSSALFGVCSGSVAANVVTSGVFTIPAMKRAGYKPEVACAIEATSSTGGQIMPPVMGATAFIMAAVIAVPYTEIAFRAIIPACLFFLCQMFQVELISRREKTLPGTDPVNKKELLLRTPLFFVPMGILLYLLLGDHTVGYATFPTIISMIVIAFLRKATRPTLRQLAESFADGAIKGAEIGVTCAALAPIVVLSTYTGLGIKLPGIVQMLSGNSSFVALLLAALVALILGMGVPTPVVYLLVAIIICPSIIKMGIPILPAHFFAFYFGIICAVTPPVAMGALIAAKMGDADYFKTGIQATKFSVVGWTVPFIFCYNQVYLGYFKNPAYDILMLILGLVMICMAAVALEGYYLTRLNLTEHVLAVISALAIFLYLCFHIVLLLVASAVLFALVTVWQLRKKMAERRFATVNPI
jgi:TRAP transporter 4TM/12TM fusion protein